MAALGVEDERSYSFLVWVLAGLENVLVELNMPGIRCRSWLCYFGSAQG